MNTKKTKIIITGGSGFIGSCLSSFLSKKYQITSIDKKKKSQFSDKSLSHFRIDLKNKAKLYEIPYKDLTEKEKYYFVHSYYVSVKDKKNSLMKTKYGLEFDSGIFFENIYGFQFHPEKSNKYGMKLLQNFSEI